MSIQQDAQLGIKAETTFGTAATVDQFVEYSPKNVVRPTGSVYLSMLCSIRKEASGLICKRVNSC